MVVVTWRSACTRGFDGWSALNAPRRDNASSVRDDERRNYNSPLMIWPVALVVGAYLVGSIPFSFLVVRLVAGRDLREEGSRNVGATNVARTVGKVPGIIALLQIGRATCREERNDRVSR